VPPVRTFPLSTMAVEAGFTRGRLGLVPPTLILPVSSVRSSAGRTERVEFAAFFRSLCIVASKFSIAPQVARCLTSWAQTSDTNVKAASVRWTFLSGGRDLSLSCKISISYKASWLSFAVRG